jgi:hypothetical protein
MGGYNMLNKKMRFGDESSDEEHDDVDQSETENPEVADEEDSETIVPEVLPQPQPSRRNRRKGTKRRASSNLDAEAPSSKSPTVEVC